MSRTYWTACPHCDGWIDVVVDDDGILIAPSKDVVTPRYRQPHLRKVSVDPRIEKRRQQWRLSSQKKYARKYVEKRVAVSS